MTLYRLIRKAVLPCLLCFGAGAYAQTWPNRPITLVVPFGPGSTDILARTLTPRVSAALGQPMVVDNRPGATGNIGSRYVARSAADGYTILLGTSAAQAVNPSLYASLGYDPLADLAPIILVASVPNVLIVNPKLPIHSVADLVAAAKARPDALNYSSNGAGSSQHIAAALFESITGVRMMHVPYKGSTEGIVAVARGDVDIMFANLPPALPLITDGRVRPLAVTTPQRIPALPQLPTVAESGAPGFEATLWFAIYAPAGTPPEIVQRLNREFAAALADSAIHDKLLAQGYVVHGGTPQNLAAYLRSESVKWARVVKESGAKVE